jgi:hypothetical protein
MFKILRTQVLLTGTVVSSTLILGFVIYSTLSNQFGAAGKAFNEFKDNAVELATSVTPQPAAKTVIYTTIISTYFNSVANIEVMEFGSEQTTKLNQKGKRDTWIFGNFLQGESSFSYLTGFTGSIVYSFKDITYEYKNNKLYVYLGIPIIKISDVKVNDISTQEGTLQDKEKFRKLILDYINEDNTDSYYYNLFFSGTHHRIKANETANQSENKVKNDLNKFITNVKNEVNAEIITNLEFLLKASNDESKKTITTEIKRIFASKKQNIDIVVIPNKTPIAQIDIKKANGETKILTLNEMFNSDVNNIINPIKKQYPETVIEADSQINKSNIKSTAIGEHNLTPAN